ncbi:hypothetical protein FGO68_gene6746 [Halteria grandinella]|uniref:Uncharacterized protein n=1 Tax=Halteria grandinella TaxID=5974 RepID=A0A8J8NCQ5_HALGN|nr:hypothetical protein FGO68_gene6746 [Halteria grandinella]
MTQGSEYLLKSFGYQQQIFGMTTTANQYMHQVELVDRLQEKIINLREEVDTQRHRADELRKAFLENRSQLEAQRKLMEKREQDFSIMLKNEMYQWEQALNKVKSLNESELQKKQREIEKLHQLLAKWIDSHQTLEKVKNAKDMQDFDKLLDETIRHKESRMTLNEVLLTQTPASRKEGVAVEKIEGPSSFMARSLRTVEKQSINGAFGQIKALRASLKSPPPMQLHKTPSSQGVYQPLATEGNIRSTNILKQHRQYAPLATQVSSPTLKMMKSEQRGERIIESQKVIMGDTSPAIQHHSSFDDNTSSDKSERNLRDIAEQIHHEEDGIRLKMIKDNFEEIKDGEESPSGSSVESSQIVLNLQSQSHQCLADSDRTSCIFAATIPQTLNEDPQVQGSNNDTEQA